MTGSPESQPELFQLAGQPAQRAPRNPLGRFYLQLRYDQLVLAGMACLLAVTVVFAGGVERGKQLARTERALLVKQPENAPAASSHAPQPASAAPQKPAATRIEPKAVPPQAPLKTKTPSRVAEETPSKKSGDRRYAIQVVTYSKLPLAKQELERLRARGERAFLVMRDGRTTLYVGPFPSKANAGEKLAKLKSQYHDCFVRVL